MEKEARKKLARKLETAYEQVGHAISDLEDDGPRYKSEAKRLESALMSLDEAIATVSDVMNALEEASDEADAAEAAKAAERGEEGKTDG